MKLIRGPRAERFPTTEFDIECYRSDCDATYRCMGSELRFKYNDTVKDEMHHFKCPSCNEEYPLSLEDLDECEVNV